MLPFQAEEKKFPPKTLHPCPMEIAQWCLAPFGDGSSKENQGSFFLPSIQRIEGLYQLNPQMQGMSSKSCWKTLVDDTNQGRADFRHLLFLFLIRALGSIIIKWWPREWSLSLWSIVVHEPYNGVICTHKHKFVLNLLQFRDSDEVTKSRHNLWATFKAGSSGQRKAYQMRNLPCPSPMSTGRFWSTFCQSLILLLLLSISVKHIKLPMTAVATCWSPMI